MFIDYEHRTEALTLLKSGVTDFRHGTYKVGKYTVTKQSMSNMRGKAI